MNIIKLLIVLIIIFFPAALAANDSEIILNQHMIETINELPSTEAGEEEEC